MFYCLAIAIITILVLSKKGAFYEKNNNMYYFVRYKQLLTRN